VTAWIQENGGPLFDPSSKDPLLRASRFWRSAHGRWMARASASRDWLYSPDGRGFQETLPGGLAAGGGRPEEGDFTEGSGVQHRYTLDGQRLVVDGELFVPVDVRPPNAAFVPLPEKRVLAYLFVRPDGGILAVTEDANRSYDTMHLFVGRWTGASPVLGQIRVRKVQRMRDGGTTIVQTDGGTLNVPTPWKPELTATWTKADGSVVKLQAADKAGVSFVESGTSLTLRFPTARPEVAR